MLFYACAQIVLIGMKWAKSKYVDRMVKFLFWNLLLRFYIESYLELAISCMINLKKSNYQMELVNDRANYTLAFVILISLVLFPLFVIIFLSWVPE